jgi:hypothetical protein
VGGLATTQGTPPFSAFHPQLSIITLPQAPALQGVEADPKTTGNGLAGLTSCRAVGSYLFYTIDKALPAW